MIERINHPETQMQLRQGVVAVFEHNERIFGIGQLRENDHKFEVALDNQSQPAFFGYLKEQGVGFLGGGVKPQEELTMALKREIQTELVALGFSDQSVIDRVADLVPEQLIEIQDFRILQASQPKAQDAAQIRALFKVHFAKIVLDDELFRILEPYLVDLMKTNQNMLRPLAQAWLAFFLGSEQGKQIHHYTGDGHHQQQYGENQTKVVMQISYQP